MVPKHHDSELLFSEVNGKIAPVVLGKVLLEIQKARRALRRKEELEPCTRTFTDTMGAPCSHWIFAKLRRQRNEPSPLGMDDFHGHWWLETSDNAHMPALAGL